MNIVDYGFFHIIEPPPGNVVLLFENEKGEDWYEVRKGLTEWNPLNGVFISAIFPTWLLVDADGMVTNIEYDPSRLMPGDRRVLGVDAPIDAFNVGMTYRDGELHAGEKPAWAP